MSTALEINGSQLCPIKEAAKQVSYSRDYVSRLAREGKVKASYINRQWYIDTASLERYIELAAAEQAIRKKQLSVERKRERQLREAVDAKQSHQHQRARTLRVRSVAVASLVLGFGLLAGFAAYGVVTSPSTPAQLANTHEGSNADRTAAVATEAPVSASVTPAVATRTVRSLGAAEEGILLLPAGAATATPAELFSDEVVVRTLADDTQAIFRVDKNGEPTGEPIPYVVVPLTRSNL